MSVAVVDIAPAGRRPTYGKFPSRYVLPVVWPVAWDSASESGSGWLKLLAAIPSGPRSSFSIAVSKGSALAAARICPPTAAP